MLPTPYEPCRSWAWKFTSSLANQNINKLFKYNSSHPKERDHFSHWTMFIFLYEKWYLHNIVVHQSLSFFSSVHLFSFGGSVYYCQFDFLMKNLLEEGFIRRVIACDSASIIEFDWFSPKGRLNKKVYLSYDWVWSRGWEATSTKFWSVWSIVWLIFY
jgi:hypothetical protein